MPGVSMIMLSMALAMASPIERSAAPAAVHVAIEREEGVSLADADVRTIAADLERIWRPAVDVVATVGSGPAGLLARDHVRLVLTMRTLPATDAAGIGWIEFVDDRPQPVLTVSLTAVNGLVRNGRWSGRPFSSLPARASALFRQRAIARAAAHELGHYLLHTKDHAPRGLMRAVYMVAEIMSGSAKLNRLDAKLIASMEGDQRERMAGGLRPANAND